MLGSENAGLGVSCHAGPRCTTAGEIDPTARLQSLIYYKENDQVEFKGGLIGEDDTDRETVMKTVAAFANGNGGSFFLELTSNTKQSDFVKPTFQSFKIRFRT